MAKKIVVYDGSKFFFDWLGIKKGDYQSLEALPEDYKAYQLEMMIQSLITEAETKSVYSSLIFSGHFCRIQTTGVTPAVGDWISNFDLIVLLKTNPEVLLKRIQGDHHSGTKKRNALMNLIALHDDRLRYVTKLLNETEETAKRVSKKYNIPLLSIDSGLQKPTKIASQIIQQIKA